MAIDTENKILEHEFRRLLLGLEDLRTIGRYFKNQEEDAQSRLRIDVASADDEDTATFTDPELLSGSSLPEKIQSIHYSLQVHPAAYIELSLPEPGRQYAKATVQSTDELLASTLLDEVMAEVGAHEVWGKGLKAFVERITGRVLVSILAPLFILGAFFIIFFVGGRILFSLFPEDIAHAIFLIFMIISVLMVPALILVSLFDGPGFVKRVLDRVLPPIEYMDELTGGSSQIRQAVKVQVMHSITGGDSHSVPWYIDWHVLVFKLAFF